MATAPAALSPDILRRILAGEQFTQDGYTYRRYSPYEAQYVPGAEGGGAAIPEDSWMPQRVKDGKIEHFDRSGNYSTTTDDGYSKWGLRDLAKAAAIVGGGYLVGTALAGVGSAGAAAGTGAAAAPGSLAPLSMADLTTALAPTNASLAAGGAGLEAGTAALAGGIPTGGGLGADVLAGEAGQDVVASTAQQAAQGGIDSASRAVLNSASGYGPGMTGAQTGLFDTLAPWIGNEAAASVAGSSSGGLIGKVISGLGSGAADVVGNLVKSVGPALAMKVLAGEVKPPTQDPALAAAINGQLEIAKSAESRANANDEYWKSTFAPRILANMDQSLAMSKELQDFELGRAKRLDDRYWNTTARFQDQFYKDVDQYNTEQNRERIAGEAIGDVRRGFSNARAIAGRDLARMGINPASGRYAGQLKQLALDEALAGAAAGTQSRRAAEDKGMQLKLTAAGLNANLPGAAGAAATGAGNAANVASQGINTASGAWGTNNAGYIGAMNAASGSYAALGGLGASLTRDAWQANTINTNQRNQIIGAGLGMLSSNWGR